MGDVMRAWGSVAVIGLIATSSLAYGRTVEKTVGAGRVALMYEYGNVQKDCSPEGGIIKVRTRPQHGKVTQQSGRSTIGYVRFPEQAACRGTTVTGVHVYYVSDPGFHGIDNFSLEVIYPHHATDIDTFTVHVE